jgi:hypothetical protein
VESGQLLHPPIPTSCNWNSNINLTQGGPFVHQIEGAILTRPVVEDVEEMSAPAVSISVASTDLLIRPLNRSVPELNLCGGSAGVRPRATSLQDYRCLKSPYGNQTVDGPIAMRSLPIPSISPPSFEGLGSGKPLNVEALPFIPPHSLKTPPAVPSEGATTATTTTPPTQDPRSIVEPPSPHPGGKGFNLISSTVKPVAPVTITTGIGSPSKQGFTRAERRAVETVINVLLEMKSKGDARASPGSLPPLILAKDRTVYKNAGTGRIDSGG